MNRLTLAVVIPALCLASLPMRAGADGSLRCAGGLVSAGDYKLDLVGKCGWPALREHVSDRTAVQQDGMGRIRSATASTERWTYDFGPNRFIQLVVLELGRIVSIERGGYGYQGEPRGPEATLPRARCPNAVFHEGESSYDVLTRCGEPAFREARVDVRSLVLGGEGAPVIQAESVRVTVELWTYDFGPASFVRHLVFEDGKLVRVETGSYGYAR